MTKTTKTFTDDSGQKYELVPIEYSATYRGKPISPTKYGLKPVMFDEKINIALDFGRLDGKKFYYRTDLELTEPTAQAIAEAIKALMEYVQTSDNGHSAKFTSRVRVKLFGAIYDARQLMQKENRAAMSINKIDPMAEDELDQILNKMLDFSPRRVGRELPDGSFRQLTGVQLREEIRAEINAYTTNKIILELERFDIDDSAYRKRRIAELKRALNHRKDR
jgi:hypothetical protein